MTASTPTTGSRSVRGSSPMRPGLASGVLLGMAGLMTWVFDRGFGHPRGLVGRLGGALMVKGNSEQERRAVERAGLSPGGAVVVVGHGPGVGLRLAAAAVAPGGHVLGVDPSVAMREMAASRCAEEIARGLVKVREGAAERTGCADDFADAVISVNNVMLWERSRGFSEAFRVLRPGGRLVISVHRHVLGVEPEVLRDEALRAGFEQVGLRVRQRRFNSPAVEILAVRPSG